MAAARIVPVLNEVGHSEAGIGMRESERAALRDAG